MADSATGVELEGNGSVGVWEFGDLDDDGFRS